MTVRKLFLRKIRFMRKTLQKEKNNYFHNQILRCFFHLLNFCRFSSNRFIFLLYFDIACYWLRLFLDINCLLFNFLRLVIISCFLILFFIGVFLAVTSVAIPIGSFACFFILSDDWSDTLVDVLNN